MTSNFDIIIIGGGASGLFAAASPSLAGLKTLLLEKMPQPGLKLLLTGNGDCNITNHDDRDEFLRHFGNNGAFLKPAFSAFPQPALLSFLTSLNISTKSGKNGKIFITGGAKKLRDALVSRINSSGHALLTDREVLQLTRNGNRFSVKTKSGCFESSAVLVCAGGKSYPQTGSDGASYHLALGHSVSDIRPSLAPITIKDFPLTASAGISFPNALVRLKKDGQTKSRTYGPADLLVTHKGFSGPLILNNSRDFSRDDGLEICWDRQLTRLFLEKFFTELRTTAPKRQVGSLNSELGIPKNFFSLLLDYINCDPGLKIADMPKSVRNRLEQVLTSWTCVIESPGDFRYAMSTAGGVSLSEINRKTMMSNIQPGLFFAGEFLDIDGDTGGYNLQAAFSTAWCASAALAAFLGKQDPIVKND